MASLISKIILIFLKIDKNFVSYFKKFFKEREKSYTKGKVSKSILKEVKKKENLKTLR